MVFTDFCGPEAHDRQIGNLPRIAAKPQTVLAFL
jgi:hypothetical protein